MGDNLSILTVQELLLAYRKVRFEPHNLGVEKLNAYVKEAQRRDATIAQFRARIIELKAELATRSAPGPDWSQAPEWADWWALDENGDGYWYEAMPEIGGFIWKQQEETRYEPDNARHNFNWRNTLQLRPDKELGKDTDDGNS